LNIFAFLALALPASAALNAGDTAPDFVAPGTLGGKEFTFRLDAALEKGPVVIYFYPSAYTTGCDIEAHTFADKQDEFEAAGTSIIGVSADNMERLNQFASDPNFCAGKFPIASDEGLAIAKSYGLQTSAGITRDEKGTLTTSDTNVVPTIYAAKRSATDSLSVLLLSLVLITRLSLS
jgi:peroxiredoxin Q/BCP